MASYALLISLSGFSCDMVKKQIGFNPPMDMFQNDRFTCFWSLEGAWGVVEIHRESGMDLVVHEGELSLKQVSVPIVVAEVKQVALGPKPIDFTRENRLLQFNAPVKIKAGEKLAFEG